jgi:hypothetical protein
MAAKKKAKKKAATKPSRIRKKSYTKKKARAKRKAVAKKKAAPKKKVAAKRRIVPAKPRKTTSPSGRVTRAANVRAHSEQSGDLQGLSRFESANSESVDELLEEGNAFEADVVQGVEEAGDEDEKEVHTHEVPEDDVPDEYLDKDE